MLQNTTKIYHIITGVHTLANISIPCDTARSSEQESNKK